MGDDQPQVFSVRIVSIDYYMTPPIPGLDISYSSLQGGQVREVPVIRIYGPTPAGQKTCLHIHQVLPYLYIPCSDLGNKEVESCAYSLCLALDKALKTKSNAGSKHQHVHSCELVRAKKFYGYHSLEELFVKIYFYYPQDVPRAANILLAGAVLDKFLQPYESHIPFLLQFLVDYNLYGMGHLHVSKLKFRYPIPDDFCRHRASQQTGLRETKNDTAYRDFTGGNPCLNTPVWISSTIPDGWVWQHFCQPDSSTNDDNPFFRRQSTSELEGDALVDDVINQQFISYTPLSQTLSDVKMVQSLIPIWKEEYERNGAPEGPSTDSARPLPQDVLKILSDESTLEQLSKVGDAEEICPHLTPGCPHLTPDALESLITNGNFVNDRLADMENNNHLPPKYLNASEIDAAEKSDIDVADKMRVSSTITPSSSKVADEDALRLLKWFSSSQAGEDIDSDDELARETVLSPLFPKDIDKMLERASNECERESQKECQDILDSIIMLNSEELTDRADDPPENNDSNKGLLDKVILQVDGSSDDVQFSSGKSHQIDPSKARPHAEVQSWPKFKADIISESKGKRPRWGSLPISSRKSNDFDGPDAFNVLDGHEKEEKKSLGTLWSGNQAERFTQVIQIDEKKVGFMQGSTIHECSVRDLMRRKRSHQLEQPDDSSKEEEERAGLTSDAECEKGNINPDPDFELMNDAEECKEYDLLIDKPPLRIAGTEFPERGINFTCTACKEDYAKPSSFYSPTLGPLPFSSGNNSKELGNKPKNEIQNNSISCTLEQLYASKPEIVSEHIDPRVLRGDCPSSCTASLPQNDFISKFDDIGESSRQSSITKLKSKETAVEDLPVLESKTTGAIETRGSPHDDQYFGLCDPQHTRKNLNWEAETVGLVPMTFSKTPPSIDWTNEPEDEVSTFLEDADKVRTYLSCRYVHNYLPFFSRNCAGEELPADYVQNEDLDSCPVKHENIKSDTVVGVPINQQNDGSCLFMLSPALSPPTWESIDKWLSFNGSSPSSYSVDATSSVVAEGSCVNITDSQCSQLDSCNALVLESVSCSDEKLNFSGEQGSNQENCGMEVRILDETGKKSDCLPDASQISGPEKTTRQTPLSQTGFRDPASDGQGQQLTLMSIEVQAETRDNLRPDPRFDAVNIIIVVCQDDADSKCDALVLLRCNSASPEKDMDAISEAKVFVFIEELQLLNYFKNVICAFDPDVVMGWDVQSGSLGFLAERAAQLGLGLLSKISRTPSPSIATSADVASERDMEGEKFSKPIAAQDIHPQNRIIDDEWGRTHASGVHVGGRIVLNIWRLLRSEVNLNMYTIESVAERVLRIKIPYIPWRVLTRWFASGPGQARFRSIEYTLRRAKLNLQMLNQLDMVNRTSELARVFGIDFFSVLSRGSQYRVESMLLRLAHTQNYLAISPGNQQVVNQPAMECLPLVMEPESSFYADPVIVLDFQSLYPSMVIAYNLCFCTCLGKITPAKANALGVSSYVPDVKVLRSLRHDLLVTPNGVMYVPSKVRKGILPMLLEEILSTRIMVKQAMKKLAPSHLVRQRILNARQLALKLIANVTYGYTAAGFSGRMPCAELADSIVQCGRRTLEAAISFVNSSDKWKARVIYGDTDSMFVLLKGRSLKEAFEIGREIAAAITVMNPNPIMLKMEKVYYPCFLLTKKRYVGYSYESPDQAKPIFDAKGIETVRRDTCGAVSKMMEQSLRIYFESNDIDKVKAYVIRQCTKILTGRVSLQDFIFAKEVRLGTYSERGGSLPPAAIVATKSMRDDPRAEPRYGERVPYVVVHGEPGARLVDMVVDPYEILDMNSPFRLNETYYITKQIMPALQRAFGLVGADLNQWFSDMPRPTRESVGKRRSLLPNPQRTRIDYYYTSSHCILCGDFVHGSSHLCHDCSKDETTACLALTGRTSKLEKDIQHLAAICRHCGGGDWRVESGVKCISLSCPVFFERRKVQKELQSISQLATANGFYPKCITEWF